MKQREIKCPKTLSGKHYWKKEKWGTIGVKKNGGYEFGIYKITPFCIYCGIIDDRKKLLFDYYKK